MKRPSFRFYVSQKSREITRTLQDGSTVQYNLVNTNALLGTQDIDGVKTGKTARAGDCLVVSSGRAPLSVKNEDGSHSITPRRLVVVVLGATDRFGLAERLLQRSWTQFDSGAFNSSAQTKWR
jgi:D-alanyl-D-alanine carboxypeptidase (penicillin-binding protein 5/6)